MGLLDFIVEHINEARSANRYSASTLAFLEHVASKAESTKLSVRKTVGNAAVKPNRISTYYRPGLDLFKKHWEIVHLFLKGATDAHALTLSEPFLRFVESELAQVPGMEKAQIVPLLTRDLMYFHNSTRTESEEEVVIDAEPVFPTEYLFVELPYSQGNRLFSNLMVFHEIGHSVFQQMTHAKDPAMNPWVEAAEHSIAAHPSLVDTEVDKETKAQVNDIINTWTQELFCDLFAVRIIGPAYTWALIDLMWLEGSLSGNRPSSTEHPPSILRLSEQLRQLRNDGWLRKADVFPRFKMAFAQTLSKESSSNVGVIGFPPHIGPALLEVIRNVLPSIRKAVKTKTQPCAPRGAKSQDFFRYHSLIEECLVNGIVPSAVIQSDRNAPGPCSIINAAYVVYTKRVDELMQRLEGTNTSDPIDRIKWQKKIESWTIKAVDDCNLMKGLANH